MEENYIVSARKYRPSTFSSVVGQKALTATLRNAIQTNRLAHAYLFCGSRGVGKTTCARIFAKTINCSNPTADGDPCNECASCRAFNENRSLNITELDAASNNSVDDIRGLIDQVQIPPVDGRYRVFIVDEVHMLSQQAFNAFLKTLEEPPAHAIFILATTEKHKIIPTILSRCQIFDFKRITIADIVDHLEFVAKSEGYTAQRNALSIIAKKADGAMRDALSIFDQVAASSRGDITYESTIENLNTLDDRYFTRLVDAFAKGDIPEALLIYKEIRDRGFDSYFFLGGLAGYLRDLMVARDPKTIPLLDTDEETLRRMNAQGAQLPPQFFYAAMSLCNDADMEYRTASSKTFLIELLLIKLCQLQSPSPISDGTGEGRKLKPIQPAATPPPGLNARGTQPATTPTHPSTPQSGAVPAIAPTAPHPNQATAAAPAVGPSTSPRKNGSVTAGAPAAALKGRAHISLSSRFAEKNEETKKAEAYKPMHRSPFTDKMLLEAWEHYMQLNAKAHVLVNTMRACPPSRTDDTTPMLNMYVANQPQVDVMTQELPGLLNFLRKELANDFIEIAVAVNNDPSRQVAYSDRDLLRHLIETNPHISDFISTFHLTLS